MCMCAFSWYTSWRRSYLCWYQDFWMCPQNLQTFVLWIANHILLICFTVLIWFVPQYIYIYIYIYIYTYDKRYEMCKVWLHQKWENDNVGHLLLPCHWLMFWYYFFSRTWTTWSAIENLFFVLPLNALLGIDFYGHIMIKPFKKQLAKNLHVLQIGTMVGTFWTFMERRNAVLNFFHSEDEKVKEIWLRFV